MQLELWLWTMCRFSILFHYLIFSLQIINEHYAVAHASVKDCSSRSYAGIN